jgi:homocitrate synthase NifV
MSQDISALLSFLELLIATEPDGIELSGQMFELLSPLPEYAGYILRIEKEADKAKFPKFCRFVCRNAAKQDEKTICEILLNDMRESYTISRYKDYKRIRIRGLSDIITTDYLQVFAHLQKVFHGEIEYCPTNRYSFATALASEWLVNGSGSTVVTSFGGIGGFAPTEEVIMILKLERLRKVGKNYSLFPEMADLLRKITGNPIRMDKPIIGNRIFHVESGIHVDGILKNPKCYEPFLPESVGLRRNIVIGKQSGTAAVKAKLDEIGIAYTPEQIPKMLEQIKANSDQKNRALTDKELIEIARGCVA